MALPGVRLVLPSLRCLVAALVSLPQPSFFYIPQTSAIPALMAPCLPILTLISVLVTLSSKSKFLSHLQAKEITEKRLLNHLGLVYWNHSR